MNHSGHTYRRDTISSNNYYRNYFLIFPPHSPMRSVVYAECVNVLSKLYHLEYRIIILMMIALPHTATAASLAIPHCVL